MTRTIAGTPDLDELRRAAEGAVAAGYDESWQVSKEGPPNHAFIEEVGAGDGEQIARVRLGSWRLEAVNLHIAKWHPVDALALLDLVIDLRDRLAKAEVADGGKWVVLQRPDRTAIGIGLQAFFDMPSNGERVIATCFQEMDAKSHRFGGQRPIFACGQGRSRAGRDAGGAAAVRLCSLRSCGRCTRRGSLLGERCRNVGHGRRSPPRCRARRRAEGGT